MHGIHSRCLANQQRKKRCAATYVGLHRLRNSFFRCPAQILRRTRFDHIFICAGLNSVVLAFQWLLCRHDNDFYHGSHLPQVRYQIQTGSLAETDIQKAHVEPDARGKLTRLSKRGGSCDLMASGFQTEAKSRNNAWIVVNKQNLARFVAGLHDHDPPPDGIEAITSLQQCRLHGSQNHTMHHALTGYPATTTKLRKIANWHDRLLRTQFSKYWCP